MNVFRNPPLPEKPHIDPQKPHIGGETSISAPTRKHILALYAELEKCPSSGRKDLCRITGLKPRAASALLLQILSLKTIEPVSGQGKGAYHFI